MGNLPEIKSILSYLIFILKYKKQEKYKKDERKIQKKYRINTMK